MPDDEAEIRTLIHRWAIAVHLGQLADVAAGHSEDIVMFDVPPPDEGVRGLSDYRSIWPPFFQWQRSGASFEITSLEVTAGVDVAYAFALLRCGTADELTAHPDHRLRVTMGLRKDNGAWSVAHEHHSFPDRTPTEG
jgi:ketosteroid isomerase-like protein